MYHIVIDFEMSPISPEIRKDLKLGSHNEIIEIGAVMLNEELETISELNIYIKPSFGDIPKHIEELTKITNMQVCGAKEFCEAFHEFAEWCSICDEYDIYAWSDADGIQLKQETCDKLTDEQDKKAAENMLAHWLDLQMMFTSAVKMRKKVSLTSALTMIGIDFEGNAHNALWDAKNTAEILKLILTEDSEGVKRIADGIQAEIERASHLTFSIASMFGGFFDEDDDNDDSLSG